MNQRKALQPHEIRVVKIDRKAILELVWEILSEIIYGKFRLPHNNRCNRACIDWVFDERQCEIILVAHNCEHNIDLDLLIQSIKEFPIEAVESLLMNPNDEECYYSFQNVSFINGHSKLGNVEFKRAQNNKFRMLLDKLGIHIRLLTKREIRIIRLSRHAICELLWEHFLATGDEIMDIPEEENGDIRTIYHMYTEGNLDVLTLYVMNINDASDKVLNQNKEYCDKNIHYTTMSYLERKTKEQKYVSVVPIWE